MRLMRSFSLTGLSYALKPIGASLIFICAVIAYGYNKDLSDKAQAVVIPISIKLPEKKKDETVNLGNLWGNHVQARVEEIYMTNKKQSLLDSYSEIPALSYLTFFGGFLILVGEWLQAHRDSSGRTPRPPRTQRLVRRRHSLRVSSRP